MANIALALPNAEAGSFLIEHLRKHRAAPETMGPLLSHAAKYLPPDLDVSTLTEIAQRGVADDIDLQLDLLLAIRDGLRQRGQAEPESLKRWGATLAGRLLASVESEKHDWEALDRDGNRGKPWQLEARRSADGTGQVPFLSTLPLGETYTGTLRSREFLIPKGLSLFVCGHLGPPDQPPSPRNKVRLRLAGTDETIAETIAPRNDVARRVFWDLSATCRETRGHRSDRRARSTLLRLDRHGTGRARRRYRAEA